jgi:hypothetical protein
LEGGNIARSPKNEMMDYESLSVLTAAPDWETRGNHFVPFLGTSPATAQASWMAAQLYSAYPAMWAETVRGLIVHSARWTDAMTKNTPIQQLKRGNVRQLLRTVGFGIPNLQRALKSVKNSVTMILQDEYFQPFVREKNTVKYNAIRLFELPLPKEILRELGNLQAEIRVTLSYFISPNPGRKGLENRYRYPSSTLRFDLNNIGEDRDDFCKRLNRREEDDEETRQSGFERWVIGSNLRHRGSLHTDIWQGAAVDMVDCRYLAVYPSGGWWKERKEYCENKVRFSLIVSLDLPETIDVNVYNAIQQEIKLKTSVSSPVTI